MKHTREIKIIISYCVILIVPLVLEKGSSKLGTLLFQKENCVSNYTFS